MEIKTHKEAYKKNRKEKINFTLLNGIGSSIINQEFTFDELLD